MRHAHLSDRSESGLGTLQSDMPDAGETLRRIYDRPARDLEHIFKLRRQTGNDQ
jgi:hypothetical protein